MSAQPRWPSIGDPGDPLKGLPGRIVVGIGGGFGPGISWGEVKMCCQVMDGQSPLHCDTPCGTGGKNGCSPCNGGAASGGASGSCTIATGRVEDNNCPRGMQFFETVTVQDANGCVSGNGQ